MSEEAIPNWRHQIYDVPEFCPNPDCTTPHEETKFPEKTRLVDIEKKGEKLFCLATECPVAYLIEVTTLNDNVRKYKPVLRGMN